MLQVELAAPAGRVGNPDLAARCHKRAAEIDTIAQKTRDLVLESRLLER